MKATYIERGEGGRGGGANGANVICGRNTLKLDDNANS